MKVDIVKTLLAVAIAGLLAFVCEIIAPETGSRNWISLGMGFASIFSLVFPAMGIRYANVPRGVSIRLVSWLGAISVIIANASFACFEYRVDVYLVVVLFMVVLGWSLIYSFSRAKTVGN